MRLNRTERLLIVGGGGFIGRHLVRAALAQSYEITVLSRRPPTPALPDAVKILCADLCEREQMRALLRGQPFERVVNLGGSIRHAPFSAGGDEMVRAHFDGVRNLVENLDRDALRRFVQIGSSDEYGRQPAPQREDLRESPVSPYALGKTAATHFLHMLHRADRFPAVILRPFLVYGPGQDRQRLLPQVIAGCLEDREFPLSSGEQLRDFCFVEEICAGILTALRAPMVEGEAINLASGQPLAIRAVVELVQRKIGRGRPLFGEIPQRRGENGALYAEIEKARRLLQWAPRIAIEEGVERTIAACREAQGI